MSTFHLGTSTVQRVGFGAMQLPGPGVFGPPRDHDAAIAVLRRAVELGVNHIDTAQYYGPDVSNALIREALHPYSDDLVLVSKVGAVRDDQGGWVPAQKPADLRAGVEDNLRSLGVEQLGAVNLRRMPDDHLPEGMEPVPFEDQLAEMVALREEGKIAGIGVSTVRLAQVELAIEQRRHRLRAERVQPARPQRRAVLDALPRRRRRLRPLLPARLRVPGDAEGHRERRGGAASPSASARRRPRSGSPGCSRTARTCC